MEASALLSLSSLIAFQLFDVVQATNDIPYFASIAVGAILPNPQRCKTTADYVADIKAIKSWPSSPFTVIHTYSTAGCNSLANAVPAAIEAGFGIWPTIFHGDDFDSDKKALVDAMKKHGSKWLKGVCVGNEALRKGFDPYQLADEINDVKETLMTLGLGDLLVGANDNEPALLDPKNAAAVEASSVIWANAYPFWAGVSSKDSGKALKGSVSRLSALAEAKGKPLVIGETGWPTAGPGFYRAKASISDSQSYWSQAGCWLQQQRISFSWFSAFDESWTDSSTERAIGLSADGTGSSRYGASKLSLSCPPSILS